MTSRRPALLTDSSTDQSLGSVGSQLSKASLLSIPKPRKHRSKSVDRSKQFISLHARYVEDNNDKPKIVTETRSPTTKKKPRRIKRTNAFYLNRATVTDEELDHRRSCTSAASDDSSRMSISNASVGESASARSLWLSQSTDTDQGSCESLNVRSRRRMKLNSALVMGQRDILINLKKKMKKKTPKYQGTIDRIQKKCITILGGSEQVESMSTRLIKSKAAHHSFETNQTNFLYCGDCGDVILKGSLVICSNESPPKNVWHPRCFKCYICGRHLVNLIYHPFEGRRYCSRHKPYLPKICSYCMEEIKFETFTRANGRYYHPEHFQCWQCAVVLSGEKYYGCGVYPMCLTCYDVQLAKPCRSCKGAIQIDTPFYSLGRKRWHATPSCFKCSGCQASLVGSKLITTKGELFCNRQCFSDLINRRASFGSSSALY
ncbi:hypothetical protein ACHWQZ_G009548 [Mnemiopsis leidyi]|uniref:TES class LIM protein ML148516b n=1 Tax=Mnemiopsis leidyi TaxID=27923 RepID=H2DJW7_MNELE|nr:TES class LIM protein ML148516b [Mnemiopsis leidyi]